MIEQMNRRDFLKAGGALLLAGLGIRMGLDRLLVPLELDQRRHTFRHLYHEADTQEGKERLRS